MNVIPNDYVLVSRETYTKLLQSDQMLDALKTVGVDNWEGYSTAIGYLNGEQLD